MVNERFDIIIIGSGAGGGTLAQSLAGTSAKILILERAADDQRLMDQIYA